MYKITKKKMLTPSICLMDIVAPRLAASAQPGQFLIVRARPEGERIPLTICDFDRAAGTVTIVTQVIGASSRLICALEEGECFTDVVGPLGCPSDFVEMPDAALAGRCYLFVAGGLGTAPVYPQAKYLHERGAHVDIVVGAKTADLLILQEEMASVCDNLYVCTDDGSAGHPGLVTEKVKLLLAEGKRVTVLLGFNRADEVFYEDEFRSLGADVTVTTADGSYGTKGFVTDALPQEYGYFYACGPEPMLKAVYRATETSGQFSFEARMGCGFGACMGCSCKTVTGTKRICREGPVLEKEEILWEN